MAQWLTTYDDLADELERIGFQPEDAERYYFRGGQLRARILWSDNGDRRVQFAEAATFDRWANSTNFEVKIPIDRPECDLAAAKKRAEEICDSGRYDFLSYFETIDLSEPPSPP